MSECAFLSMRQRTIFFAALITSFLKLESTLVKINIVGVLMDMIRRCEKYSYKRKSRIIHLV